MNNTIVIVVLVKTDPVSLSSVSFHEMLRFCGPLPSKAGCSSAAVQVRAHTTQAWTPVCSQPCYCRGRNPYGIVWNLTCLGLV